MKYYLYNNILHRIRTVRGERISEARQDGRWMQRNKPDLVEHFGKAVDPADHPEERVEKTEPEPPRNKRPAPSGFGPSASPSDAPDGGGPPARPCRPQSAGRPRPASTAAAGADAFGWNWGAFLLNWIWCLGNGVLIPVFFCFFPPTAWAMPFVLGIKGDAWAWEKRGYMGFERFRRAQRAWALAGAAIWGVLLLCIGAAAYYGLPLLSESEVYTNAVRRVQEDPRVRDALGDPVEASFFINGEITVNNGAGRGDLTFDVSGPKGSGTVRAVSKRTDGAWTPEYLAVRVHATGETIVLVGEEENKGAGRKKTPLRNDDEPV